MARSEAIAEKLKQLRTNISRHGHHGAKRREGSHEALGAPQPANYPTPRGYFEGSVHTALVLFISRSSKLEEGGPRFLPNSALC